MKPSERATAAAQEPRSQASQHLLSSGVMPSSVTSMSTVQSSTAPIVSLTTRKRMYPKISKEYGDRALLSMGEMVRQRWLIKVRIKVLYILFDSCISDYTFV